MKAARTWWGIYAACAATLLLALVWITVMVLRLEQAEYVARIDARHQESVRLALWRLDSWLMPHLARESGRPYFEYQPFYPQWRAYTRLLDAIEAGEVLTPSPLLSFQSDYVRLHFQMSPNGVLTSPQVPEGALRSLAVTGHLSVGTIEANSAILSYLSRVLRAEKVVNCVAESEAPTVSDAVDELFADHVPPLERDLPLPAQEALSQQEWTKRKGLFLQNIEAASQFQMLAPSLSRDDAPGVDVGPFVPLWIAPVDPQSRNELVFIRRVRVENREYYQGFLCHWPRLKKALLAEIDDLSHDADLVPMGNPTQAESARGAMLATVPVLLRMDAPILSALSWLTPIRATTALTWLAVIAGLVAVGSTMRQTIAFGEKRSRFATAVTHELRTPLTTFRMYTEMLADGMVPDATQRQTYLETLREESGRLAALVENVLSYAQLEEGRRPTHRRRAEVREIIERLEPPLTRRAVDAGMTLRIDNTLPADTMLHTDADALGQILLNLVDNACKYAHDADDRSIELTLTREGESIRIAVRDHGPGVSAEQSRSIFEPFERGPDQRHDQPGIGLGLALSRGLARDLGGDLVLVSADAGACFVVTLPLAG